ncbi:oxygenase MpaB family protein [Nocardia sp. CA-129566]|uniref:oxygenase MpaB family protein n=1 Tax=Nocardia sp. CA-129566 TaxID=3239976 RepID=UPI003D994EB2
MNGTDGKHGRLGPDSASWRLMRERIVILGGMRALLMQSAHPSIAAAAERTGKYERDPWGRLDRTLRLTFMLTFGTREEITSAARQINRTHRAIHGTDDRTGLRYSAADQDLILWVHASLVSSFLLFERAGVGEFDAGDRQLFHQEMTATSTLLGLDAASTPPTVAALDEYVRSVLTGGTLRATTGSRTLKALMAAEGIDLRYPMSAVARYLAFHTLPTELRELYAVAHTDRDSVTVACLFAALRNGRRLLPRSRRYTDTANAAYARLGGVKVDLAGVPVLPARRHEAPHGDR